MDWTAMLSAGVAFLIYVNTLPAQFAYDDSRAIVKNPDLLPATPVWNLFVDDFWGTPLRHSGSHKSYRPLCVLTFRLNYLLSGLDPFSYHLVNVLLHAGVTAVYVLTVRKAVVDCPSDVVLVSGLMFAVHPIHAEAVAGVVGRADVLACLFFLLAVNLYVDYCNARHRREAPTLNGCGRASRCTRWMYFVGFVLSACASMLSKEHGVTVVAVCLVYDLFLHQRLRPTHLLALHKYREERRHSAEAVVLLTATVIILVVLRMTLMGFNAPDFSPSDNPASDADSLSTRSMTFAYLPAFNFFLMLCPARLSFDWSMSAVPLVDTWSDVRNLVTSAFYVSLILMTWRIARDVNCPTESAVVTSNGHCGDVGGLRSKRSPPPPSGSRRGHVLLLAVALLILPFIPATNLFFYVGFVVAERVLYIPSTGYCLLVSLAVTQCRRRVARFSGCVSTYGVMALLTSLAVRTYVRNADWWNEEALYRSGISVNPAKAWGNLANVLNADGRSVEAEHAYKAALRHRSNMADVHYNLAILYQEQRRYDEAIDSYKMAIQCRPRLTMAYLNLGIVYTAVGMKSAAEKVYRHCSHIDISGLKDPRLHEQTVISALYNLGRLLDDDGRHQEAVDLYLEAVNKLPSHYAPQSLYNMLGEAYFKLSDWDSAELWYREALRTKPDHIPAHLTLAKLLHRQGSLDAAELLFIKARHIDPSDASVHQHYGQFLNDVGRHAEAADSYLTASRLLPDDFELIFNTASALRQAGSNDEAELYYKRSVELRPDVALAHMNLGAMLHYNGKLREAELSYLNALRLQPSDDVTRANLQKLRSRLQRL